MYSLHFFSRFLFIYNVLNQLKVKAYLKNFRFFENYSAISGSSGKWVGRVAKKGHSVMIGGKKINHLLEYKAMSNSLLYHTFGIRSVQHISTDFLTARRSFDVHCTPAGCSVRSVDLGMWFNMVISGGHLKLCLSAESISNWWYTFPACAAKTAVRYDRRILILPIRRNITPVHLSGLLLTCAG